LTQQLQSSPTSIQRQTIEHREVISDPQSSAELPSTPLAESVEIIHRTSRKRKGSSVPLWDSDDIDAYWEAEANEPEVVVPGHQLESIQRMVAEMEQSLKTVTGQMEVLKGMIEMVVSEDECAIGSAERLLGSLAENECGAEEIR